MSQMSRNNKEEFTTDRVLIRLFFKKNIFTCVLFYMVLSMHIKGVRYSCARYI